MYFASGDDPGLNVTNSDPDATAVGGTTLGIGAANHLVFETGWSDDTGFLDNGTWTDAGINGPAGGTSLVWGQPAYQKGVVPRRCRVSASASGSPPTARCPTSPPTPTSTPAS